MPDDVFAVVGSGNAVILRVAGGSSNLSIISALYSAQKRGVEAIAHLMEGLGGLLSIFLRPDNIPGLVPCPATADGNRVLCGRGISAAVTICFVTGSSSDFHSIFNPCCCQGARSKGLLFAGANITSMRNSKRAEVLCCNHRCAQWFCRQGHTQLDSSNAKIRSACFQ